MSGAGMLSRALLSKVGRPSIDALAVPAILVALCLYLTATSSVFLTRLNIENILTQVAVLAIVAFGVTLVTLAGELDLSVGSVVSLSSVSGAIVIRDGSPIWFGVLVGVAVGAAAGLVNGAIVVAFRAPSFVVTLGTLGIGQGLANYVSDGSTITPLPSEIGDLTSTRFLGVRAIVYVVLAVLLLCWFLQSQTTFGRRIYATGGNREAARLAAVPTGFVRIGVFTLSGALAGLAGMVLTSRLESGQPSGGTLLELTAIAAVVVGGTSLYGGRGSVIRTLFGVLLFGVLANGLDLRGVTDDLQRVIVGVVLIVAASADFFRRSGGGRAGGGLLGHLLRKRGGAAAPPEVAVARTSEASTSPSGDPADSGR